MSSIHTVYHSTSTPKPSLQPLTNKFEALHKALRDSNETFQEILESISEQELVSYLRSDDLNILEILFERFHPVKAKLLLDKIPNEEAKVLLNKIPQNNDLRITYLMKAMFCRSCEMAKVFLEAGADVNKQDNTGDTALAYALGNVRDDHYYAYKDKKNAQDLNDYDNNITLRECIDRKDELLANISNDYLKYYLDSLEDDFAFNPNLIDESVYNYANRQAQKTISKREKGVELVKLLIKHGANINMKNYVGSSPLNFTTLRYITRIERFYLDENDDELYFPQLLMELNSDCNIKNNQGLTLLMRLAANEFYPDKIVINLMSILLKNGADINIVDNVGLSTLDYAIIANNEKIAAFLREHNAVSPDPSLTNSLKAAMDGIDMLSDSKPKAFVVFPSYNTRLEKVAYAKYFTIPDVAFLAKKYSLTIQYGGSREDFQNHLSNNQYELFYVAGHGTNDSIHLSDDFVLKKDQIEDYDFSKTNPNLLFVLDSCSTGSQNGIAEKIAEVSHRKVVAPKEDAQPELCEYHYRNEDLIATFGVVDAQGQIRNITNVIDPICPSLA